MASVIVKWQNCGKQACRCREGMLHGPYFWLVSYISKKSDDRRRGKYSWRYLGKNPMDVWKKLEILDERFKEKYDLLDLNTRLNKIAKMREKIPDVKTTERILTIDDVLRGK
ncbi:MAG: hypothetical protein JSW11_12835 [Candidatus Heimdallarchaeota archaeon]|nr:MAG: hypothetical protein JSW11_12835 [Candidatus Heimdallarchaeota archaeon]